MSLPSRSKVFAVISLAIAVILISINVVSCVSESHFFSKEKVLNNEQNDPSRASIQPTLDDPNQFNN